MNAADLARLELAKRAYRAVEPSAAEVQQGVRAARLSLRRPGQRRTWFSKTLVAVVLAMGGLAYANPHTLGEWVESALRSGAGTPKRSPGVGAAPEAVEMKPTERLPKLAAGSVPVLREPPEAASIPAAERALPAPSPPAPLHAQGRAHRNVAPSTSGWSSRVAPGAKGSETAPDAETAGSDVDTASEWGRVGAALARGDESSAFSALKELSQSEDPRTRDKADLGRAQLLMASGHREQACTMARSLTNRRAGSRIERQAQALLKSCMRYNP